MGDVHLYWLFTQGEWQEVEGPEDLEAWYERWVQWGDAPILLSTGKEGAPAPYLVDLAHYGEPVLVADFPSHVQLLEKLAPIVAADSIAQYLKHRQWKWEKKEDRKEQKRRRKAADGLNQEAQPSSSPSPAKQNKHKKKHC